MSRSMEAERRKQLQKGWPAIELMIAGLQDGMLEAFEQLGRVLAEHMDTPWQADLYMALIFELLPLEAQEKIIADPRVDESVTVITVLKKLRKGRPDPASGRR